MGKVNQWAALAHPVRGLVYSAKLAICEHAAEKPNREKRRNHSPPPVDSKAMPGRDAGNQSMLGNREDRGQVPGLCKFSGEKKIREIIQPNFFILQMRSQGLQRNDLPEIPE